MSLDACGFCVVEDVVSSDAISTISAELDALPLAGAGTRNLLERSWCRLLVDRLRGNEALNAMLPASSVAIQCTLFDKSPDRNWLVALHQDLSIPVRSPVEHPELGPWSLKEGQHFVQAPAALLEQLVAVRIHLDDCGVANGPLRVVPGSHQHGRLAESAARKLRDSCGEMICSVRAGGALLMRPLLLHASSKAASPRSRRVLHFLFAPESAGYGLTWQNPA